jgi:peroxiredoxin
MNKCKLLALFAATGVALSAVVMTTTSAVAEPPKDQPKDQPADQPKDAHKDEHKDHKKDEKKPEKKTAGAEIGQKAPDFSLTDTDGKTVKLADFSGKIVVLEWFNPECPIIMRHHKSGTTFNDLHKEYSEKGVVFLAINSSGKGLQGSGVELNKTKKTEYKLPYPILMDESGEVGRAYGAKTTPHCYIINKDGALAYNGAIDNDASDKASSKNYVKNALDQVLRGETVTESKTKPYGCGVKYGKKG